MNLFNQLIGHLVSCKNASRLISQRRERELTATERWKLKWHLAVCAMCLAFEKQLRILAEAMRRYRQ
jgi:hypothetical protein